MGFKHILAAGCVLAGLTAAPLRADVKAGADAWGRADYAAAVREWTGPAAAGDPDAQFNLAQAYRLGRGVERDLTRAEALFAKAAAQGHVQAADNYGLLLFDRGERATAMPYVRAASDRGDPRAQYLVGIALFNGDLATKDWPRAYALMTLAQAAGLAQAAPALAQMDAYIPLAQRQAGATLAAKLGRDAETTRAGQIAAADLGTAPPLVTATARLYPAAPTVTPPLVHPEAAVASAVRTAGSASAQAAGADYARPAVVAASVPQAKPAAAKPLPQKPEPKPAPKPEPKPVLAMKPAPAAKPAPTGNWRVQLGAFGVAGNADALWNRARGRPELAGHARINVKVGSVTKLQAGGFSREGANTACAGLTRAGFTCLPAQD